MHMSSHTTRPLQPQPRHRTDEPDIGSGEKSPGQVDTEKMIEQVPKQPARPDDSGKQNQ